MPNLSQLIHDFLKSHRPNGLPPLIVILGPTASGKTALSLKLAKEFNGEIISADSRQIFKGVKIATDKISPEEQAAIPHHMIDVAEPIEPFTVADYQDRVFAIIEEMCKRNKLPFLVGGTGLYIDAITKNFQIPRSKPDWNLRNNLEKEIIEKGEQFVWGKLCSLDSESAKNIDPRNHRYLIRAMEIALSGQKKTKSTGPARYRVLKIGIDWPREKLYERINQRVEAQIKRGLIGEVKQFRTRYNEALPVMTSLGVRQIFKYLDGELSLDETIELLKTATRHFARRQLTWWRRDGEIVWVKGEEIFG